MSAVKNRALRA